MAIGAVLSETSLVIDTDVLTDWRYQKPYVQNAISNHISRAKRPPALTSISTFEALFGFENKAVRVGALDDRTLQDRLRTEQLISACPVLPFDQAAATIAAYIFPRLSKSHRNKHWRDIFITATALAHGHGIATRNRDDFTLIAEHLPPSNSLLRLVIWKP
jgi:predicted nucleic acid-binding protein